MRFTEHDLRQLDEAYLEGCSARQLREVSKRLLEDLKEARDRLNQTPANSSRPSGSMAPWERGESSAAKQSASAEKEAESEDANTEQRDDEDAAGAEKHSASRVSPSTRTAPSRQAKSRGKQPGAPGYGRTQVFPATDWQAHHPSTCAACGAALWAQNAAVACNGWDQIDLVPPADHVGLALQCTRHTLYETRCQCGHVTRARPWRAGADDDWGHTDLTEWRLVGPHLAAMIVMLALRMRLSRARIQEFFQVFIGLELATGTIDQTIREAGRAALPLEEKLATEIQQAPLLHVDETPWKEAGALLWLWALVSATTVLFVIGYRQAEMLINVLEDQFIGVLMSDGYVVYRGWNNRLRCWAHLLRKMQGLADSTHARVAQAGQEMKAILERLMAAIYAARQQPPPGSLLEGQCAADVATLKARCEQYRDDPHDKLQALARELLLDWDVILRQVREPHLPLTNNLAEQALRHWVIARRISHGTRSATGTRAFGLLASVIETCRRRNACAWRFLASVIATARQGFHAPPLPIVNA
jgi:transposase